MQPQTIYMSNSAFDAHLDGIQYLKNQNSANNNNWDILQ